MESVIYYFFIFLAEAMILWQYTFRLFTARCRLSVKIAVLCGLYLILFAASLLGSKWLNVALYLIVNFIFLATQCRLDWYAAFFHSSILTAVMIICELIVYYSITYFAPDFFAKADIFHNLTIFAIFSKLIYAMIVSVLLHFLKGQNNDNCQHDKTVFLLALIPITSVFVMLTFIRISDSCALSPALNWMVTFSAAFLLAINLLVFGSSQYHQKKSMEFTEMQLLLQKESDSVQYYEMLLAQNENQSILIHDMKKHLQSIDILNAQKEHDKIDAYIHQLMHSPDLKEISRICDHRLLNAILSRYQRQCINQCIAFQADIRSGTMDFLSDADITPLFCNLLDNAIEAACSMPDSFIELSTFKREKTPFVVITVVNSCRKNPFAGQSGRLFTTKPDKCRHGFGITSIRKIAGKYHGDMQMHYNQDTLTFHTVITLKQLESAL